MVVEKHCRVSWILGQTEAEVKYIAMETAGNQTVCGVSCCTLLWLCSGALYQTEMRATRTLQRSIFERNLRNLLHNAGAFSRKGEFPEFTYKRFPSHGIQIVTVDVKAIFCNTPPNSRQLTPQFKLQQYFN